MITTESVPRGQNESTIVKKRRIECAIYIFIGCSQTWGYNIVIEIMITWVAYVFMPKESLSFSLVKCAERLDIQNALGWQIYAHQ